MTTNEMKWWSAKDPRDRRWYWFDFAPMIPAGLTITSCVTEIPAAQHEFADPYVDLEKVDDAIIEGTVVGFLCTGGTPAQYNIHYHAIASDGEEFDTDKTLEVKERINP